MLQIEYSIKGNSVIVAKLNEVLLRPHTHTHTHSNTHTHIHNILRQYLLYIDGHIQYVYLFCTLYTVQCVFPLISYILFILYFQLFITGILICNLFNDSLRRGGAQS